MFSFKVLVDADSCPKKVREHIALSAARQEFKAVFAANREIVVGQKSAWCSCVVCVSEKDSADNYLFAEAEENDIVVTRDIPFAARLVEKGLCVMNDRGFVFTKYNIQDKLMERAFNMNLSEIGFASKNKKTYYGDKEFAKFSACFDTEVEKRLAFRAAN